MFQRSQRKTSCISARRGAVMVEGALVLSLLLMLLLGLLDLGIAMQQHHALTEAARKLAREAALHGAMAGPERTLWGPIACTGHLADGSAQADVIKRLFVIGNPGNVSFQITWPEGGNSLDQQVRVNLTFTRPPLLPVQFLTGTFSLQATSVMSVLH